MASAEILAAAGFGSVDVHSVRDVSAAAFIAKYAAFLKKSGKLSQPDWVDIVKTSSAKELPPLDPDWYYVRAASIARKIYLNGGIGVGALSRWYGSKKSCGNRPEHFRKASRGIIRHILTSLQKANLVQVTDKGGRQMTPEGQKELDTVARSVSA